MFVEDWRVRIEEAREEVTTGRKESLGSSERCAVCVRELSSSSDERTGEVAQLESEVLLEVRLELFMAERILRGQPETAGSPHLRHA